MNRVTAHFRLRPAGRKKRILAVSQHYWPEPFPFDEMCEAIAGKGHEVEVVTDVPNYPAGTVYPEYRHGKRRKEVKNGVLIGRVFTVGRRKSLLFRFLNYYSYALFSTLHILRLRKEYDTVLICQSSPVMMAYAGLVYARLHGKKAVLYCMDLWPASLQAGGIRPGSLLYRYYRLVSGMVYRQADRILVTSEAYADYMKKEFRIPEADIRFVPQFSLAGEMAGPLPRVEDEFNIVYAGNIGKAQKAHMVLAAAESFRDQDVRYAGRRIRWHFIGDGSEASGLRRAAAQKQLDNVVFHGRKQKEELSFFLSFADICVLCLTKDADISRVIPARFLMFLAAGKPVLAAADGMTAELIRERGCGICAPAEDEAGFVQAARDILAADLGRLGENSRRLYEEQFGRDRFVRRIEETLSDLETEETAGEMIWCLY